MKIAQEMRVTFLVNVWINHKPVGAVPFPDGVVAMKTTTDTVNILTLYYFNFYLFL